MENNDYCYKCKTKLRKVMHKRNGPKQCYECRPKRNYYPIKIKKSKPIPESETELGDGSIFEDCPKAIKEYNLEAGVSSTKTQRKDISYGTSDIYK
jgi:hypothetical protein